MPTFSQALRPISITTPLGPDALLLEALTGTESISQLFSYQLELLAEPATDVPFDRLLGQSVTVKLSSREGFHRYVNGIISSLTQGYEIRGPEGAVQFISYEATVVPKLWLLTRQKRSRTFQQMNIPDILKKVLTGIDVKWSIQGTFESRDYCIQYRETDFAFASRLMEEEGIYYYFTHSESGHTLVLANTPQDHVEVPEVSTLIFEPLQGGNRPEDRVYGWAKSQNLRSGKATLWDHCFELPGQNLESSTPSQESVQVGDTAHKLKLSVNESLELYDYPGEYAQRFDGIAPGGGDRASDVQKIFQDNARTAKIRMQQEAALSLVIRGESSCRQLTPGHKFTLDRHFSADGDYVVTRVEHRASIRGQYQNLRDEFEPEYRNTFECIPLALPYRPQRVTPKSLHFGTQTAVVVGPSGEEIFTDKYSRVKVQFPWDREGKKDADSSCWVRVATTWAGKNWGAIHIPRIGQEVIVAFEEGDTDRPIIVGSVYNAEQMPPYTLPDNRTQSGIKSRSSLQGTDENFNELRFEDKKGEEQIYFHAEKNFDRVVENNDTLKVGFEKKDQGDQTVEIFNNQTTKIGAGKTEAADGSQDIEIFNNQTVKIGDPAASGSSQTIEIYKDRTATIKTGNETLTINQGNRTTTLDMGNDKHQLAMGNREVLIDMGNDTLTIAMGNQTTKLNLGASSTEAMQSITLKVGASKVTVDQTGVSIEGMIVKINGTMMTDVKGLMTTINGSAMCKLGGGITMIG